MLYRVSDDDVRDNYDLKAQQLNRGEVDKSVERRSNSTAVGSNHKRHIIFLSLNYLRHNVVGKSKQCHLFQRE